MKVRICELLWIRSLLKDIGYEQKDAMKIYCDNNSAIEIAKTLSNMIVQNMWKLTGISSKRRLKMVLLPFLL